MKKWSSQEVRSKILSNHFAIFNNSMAQLCRIQSSRSKQRLKESYRRSEIKGGMDLNKQSTLDWKKSSRIAHEEHKTCKVCKKLSENRSRHDGSIEANALSTSAKQHDPQAKLQFVLEEPLSRSKRTGGWLVQIAQHARIGANIRIKRLHLD